MRGHPGVRKLQQHDDRAEHGLDHVEHAGRDDEPQHGAVVAVRGDGDDPQRRQREAAGHPEEAVEPLDLRRDVEAREELPMARRPVGAAEAGAAHADHAAPHDDEERCEQREIDEGAIAGTGCHESRVMR